MRSHAHIISLPYTVNACKYSGKEFETCGGSIRMSCRSLNRLPRRRNAAMGGTRFRACHRDFYVGGGV